MTQIQQSAVAETAGAVHNAISSVAEAYGRMVQALILENQKLRMEVLALRALADAGRQPPAPVACERGAAIPDPQSSSL